ncbi:hypothetical protein Q5752_002718 [Cryptotrichosporon argae]
MGDSAMRGIGVGQDSRFKDKEALSIKATKFPPEFDKKVDLRKVNISVLRPWIAQRVTELIRVEDDVVVEYVYGMLEDRDKPIPDPRKMQVNLIGFMDKYAAAAFMNELWNLLLSAQETVGGVPAEFIAAKKAELERQRQGQPVPAGSAPSISNRPPVDARDHNRRDDGKPFLPPPGSGMREAQRPRNDRGYDRDGGRGRGGYGGGGGYGRRGGNDFERTRDSGYGARAGRERSPSPGYRRRDSPPRRRDDSPPRRRDYSPPRRREASPPRRRDDSPRRRDESPPRRRRRSSTPPTRKYGASPVRRRSPSPPRRRQRSSTPPAARRDDTPPRRRAADDDMPPRQRSETPPACTKPTRDTRDDTPPAPPRRRSSTPRDRSPSVTPPHRGRADDTQPRARDDSATPPPRAKRRHDSPPRRDDTPPRPRVVSRSPERTKRAAPEAEAPPAKKEKKLEGPLARSKWA